MIGGIGLILMCLGGILLNESEKIEQGEPVATIGALMIFVGIIFVAIWHFG